MGFPGIFISYAFDNTVGYTRFVDALNEYMAFDNKSIPKQERLNDSDDRIRASIYERIRSSDIVVVLIDHSVCDRPWIQYEMKTAAKLKKPILGVCQTPPNGNMDGVPAALMCLLGASFPGSPERA